MARLVAKDIHQNNPCDNEVALCIQNKDTIPSSYNWEDPNNHSNGKENIYFDFL